MNEILVLQKNVGETPLECLNRYRTGHPEYADVKMTYAGRLDPMAEGALLVLTGERIYEKESLLSLPKVYECTAIVGIETDTYDILGMPVAGSLLPANPHPQLLSRPLRQRSVASRGRGVERALLDFIGTFIQSYPPYSSKTVNGKQLHAHAREGTLENIELPSQTVTVSRLKVLETKEVAASELIQEIIERISLVKGDFRQQEIIAQWAGLKDVLGDAKAGLVTFTISVSGGTYIRGIVHEWGRNIGKGACVFKLKRLSVGHYQLLDI